MARAKTAERVDSVVLRFTEPVVVYDGAGRRIGYASAVEMSVRQAVSLATELARLVTRLVDAGEVKVR